MDLQIRHLIPNDIFHKSFSSLRRHNIMYLDQLTSINAQYLHNWVTMYRKTFTCGSKKTAQWYKSLRQIVVDTHSNNKLKPQHFTP